MIVLAVSLLRYHFTGRKLWNNMTISLAFLDSNIGMFGMTGVAVAGIAISLPRA